MLLFKVRCCCVVLFVIIVRCCRYCLFVGLCSLHVVVYCLLLFLLVVGGRWSVVVCYCLVCYCLLCVVCCVLFCVRCGVWLSFGGYRM